MQVLVYGCVRRDVTGTMEAWEGNLRGESRYYGGDRIVPTDDC